MSGGVVTAAEMLWLWAVLSAVLSTANSHQGLVCVNDFVNNVSCTWNSSAAAGPADDCWVNATKKISIRENGNRQMRTIRGICKLQQQGVSLSGCSLVFEREINLADDSNISVECDGKLVEKITKYSMKRHIKMNPPDAPIVNSTTNGTQLSWTMSGPKSVFLKEFDFQTQARCRNQTWEEALNLPGPEPRLRVSSERFVGRCQARVRVKPSNRPGSHWSDWSPTTSWTGAADPSPTEDGSVEKTSPVVWAVRLSAALLVVLVICTVCVSKRHLKPKPLPNPSKYFLSLHSDHGGNLKNWLNPLSVSDSFSVQPCDHISPVELCSGLDVEPQTSPSTSSTSALLQTRSLPSTAASDRSRVVGETSSSSSSSSSISSSCFSNMGYFLSSSSGSAAQTDPSAAYCTHQDQVLKPPMAHVLHLSIHPSSSCSSSAAYERLKREPQSPDSGFDLTQESEGDVYEEIDDVLGDCLKHRLLFFPLNPASSTCVTCAAVAPAHSLPPLCSVELLDDDDDDDDDDGDGDDDDNDVGDDDDHDEAPTPAASINYTAWPVADATCRPSSLPSDSCKPGYLTLKELQTTFRNKSL